MKFVAKRFLAPFFFSNYNTCTVFYSYKAYLNAKGGPAVLVLTHDVKRCLADSKAGSGIMTIVSVAGTTALCLMESDVKLQNEYLNDIHKKFEDLQNDEVKRRSMTGANKFHLMAAQVGLSLNLGIEAGKLVMSPFHDVVVFDFEPRSGRREFVISVLGEGGAK